MRKKSLPVDYLKQLLAYDPETGLLTWKERPRDLFDNPDLVAKRWNSRYAGKIAGGVWKENGRSYIHVSINSVRYKAHRIAWAICYGQWPLHGIDHIDGDGLNNRISNLRDVPQKINMRNMKAPKTNTSGHVGVYWHKRASKWFAEIQEQGQRRYLGLFESIDDAVEARMIALSGRGYTERHGAQT